MLGQRGMAIPWGRSPQRVGEESTEYLPLQTSTSDDSSMSEALVRSGTNMGEGASIAPDAGSGTRGGVPEWKGAGTMRRAPG
jgi:hypothetical protein